MDTATDQPAAPAVRYLTDRPRVKTVTLSWPFMLGDVEYRDVEVRRMTAGEVTAFVDEIRNSPQEGRRFPLFYHQGALLSDEAWEALDADDVDALSEVATDFLARRFKLTPTETKPEESSREPSDSSPDKPATGDSTSAASLTPPSAI